MSSKADSVDTADAEVWVELSRDADGVGLTVYEGTEDESATVRDETWWTWAEFTGIDTTELPISRGGTTRLEATPSTGILTTDNILDVVFESDLKLAKFGEMMGEIDGDPIFDDMELPNEQDALKELTDTI